MKKLILLISLFVGCEQSHSPKVPGNTATHQQSKSDQSQNTAADTVINLLPLGDSRLIGPLQDEWSFDIEGDLLSKLFESNQKIITIPSTQKYTQSLIVNNQFIPIYAQGLRDAYDEYATKNQRYIALETLWTKNHLHVVMGHTSNLTNEGVYIAERTDLLVLQGDTIIDGVTLYYILSTFAWGAYQLFYIDEQKQIHLQRFLVDEESVQTMESQSLVILPNGKIIKK